MDANEAIGTGPMAKAPRTVFEARDDIGIDELRTHVQVVRRKIAAGQPVFRAGQPFHSLFLVGFGCLKTSELADDGREQVTGFRMRGDLLGVESIGLARYACDVVALEDSEVWELPYPPMLTACLRVPALQARLTESLAAEIRRDGARSPDHRIPGGVLHTAEIAAFRAAAARGGQCRDQRRTCEADRHVFSDRRQTSAAAGRRDAHASSRTRRPSRDAARSARP